MIATHCHYIGYIRHDIDNEILTSELPHTTKVGGPVTIGLVADEDDRRQHHHLCQSRSTGRIQLEDNTVFERSQDLENIVMIDETETHLLAYEDDNLIEPNL